MPRELPRREIEDPKTVEPQYKQNEHELGKNGLKNTSRWKGDKKTPTSPDLTSSQEYSAQFQTTVDELKKIANFGVVLGSQRAAESWKKAAENARSDLGGFWNDVKQEVAYETRGDPQRDARLKTTLDWLELAERDGGLSTWLEQWNNTVSSPWSWAMVVDSVGEIKQGITFCKKIIEGGMGDLKDDPSRLKLLFALDAVGSEITRQAPEIISGKQLDSGKPFDGVVERFKGVSPRTGISGRLHDAIEKGNLHQTWANELPDAIRHNSATDGLSDSLKTWQDKADTVRDVMSGPHTSQNEDEAAKELDAAAEAIIKNINSLTKYGPGTPFERTGYQAVDQISMALHVYQRMAAEILAQHRELWKQATSNVAKKTLRGGVYFQDLIHTAANLEAAEPGKSMYSSARDWASKGRLDEFWRRGKDSVDTGFAKAVGQDLETLLTRWTKRTTETSYPLAWELIANVRSLKSRSETLLANAPTQRDYIRSVLDTIADLIAADLQ